MGRAAAGAAGIRRPGRLCLEEELAKLRRLARQDCRRTRDRPRATAVACLRRLSSPVFRCCRSRKRDGSRIPRLRENFIERVFAFRRLKDHFNGRWTIASLVAFHTSHKMTLLSHSTSGYQKIGRLVARAKELPRGEMRAQYEQLFMATLAAPADTRRHTNVLMHMAGHLKKRLDPTSRKELADCIDEYRRGLLPLIVPITLLAHHVRVHGVAYLAGQTYLQPHPRELMLRNHV